MLYLAALHERRSRHGGRPLPALKRRHPIKVTKAVIPAAGRGTRMLPASRAVPKELLPLVDRPVLHYVMEEALDAGLREVIFVISKGKESIADYFSPLGGPAVKRGNRTEWWEEVLHRMAGMEQAYVYQHEPRGLGHAVLAARIAVGHEPFAVLLPDVVVTGRPGALAESLRLAERKESSVITVAEVPRDQLGRFGVIAPGPEEDGVYRVQGLVEKPSPERAPSNLGIVGRYVLTPAVFDALEDTPPGAGGEIQLTDGISRLLAKETVLAQVVKDKWYDTGTPLGLLQASVELALEREDLGPQVRGWLRGLAQQP